MKSSLFALTLRASTLFIAMMFFSSAHAVAQQNPKELVIELTKQFINLSPQERSAIQASAREQQRFVRENLLPFFAQRQMAQYVMGVHWRNASEAQRDAFQKALMNNLVQNYSSNLFSVPIQTIAIKNVRLPKNRRAEINTEIALQNGERQPLTYRALQKKSDGQWYLYDFSFSNISALVTLQTLYAPMMHLKGIDAVIAMLESGRRY